MADFIRESRGQPTSGGAPAIGALNASTHDQHFRKVLDELPAAVYTTDALGRITYFNEAAAQMWGHRPLIGTSEWCGSWKLYWPDGTFLPHGDCPMAVAIKEKRPVRGMEAIAERPDGSRIPFIPYPTPLFDASGMLIGAVNMLVDITDRKRSEEFHQRLSAIVESSHDAIVSKTLDGTISSWNRAAERLFGYPQEEAIGNSILMLIPPDRHDEEREIIQRIKSGERVEHYETVRRRKDGSLIELSITVSPVRDASGRVIAASKIARDITERRRAEEQNKLLLGEMKHRSRNFVAIIDAIARQSRPEGDPGAAIALDMFASRLRALLSMGELVVDSSARRAPLGKVFEAALQPFADPKHPHSLSMMGPHFEVPEQTAGGLALAAHELATNALKYGALKSPEGRVSLSWAVDDAGMMRIEWKERGGPAISATPERKGFGSRVIQTAVSGEREGKTILSFEPDGVRCVFEFRANT